MSSAGGSSIPGSSTVRSGSRVFALRQGGGRGDRDPTVGFVSGGPADLRRSGRRRAAWIGHRGYCCCHRPRATRHGCESLVSPIRGAVAQKARFATDPGLRAGLVSAAKLFAAHDLASHVSQAERTFFKMTVPRVVEGMVASGDSSFEQRRRRDLRERLPGVCCVEMEGAAVAQVWRLVRSRLTSSKTARRWRLRSMALMGRSKSRIGPRDDHLINAAGLRALGAS